MRHKDYGIVNRKVYANLKYYESMRSRYLLHKSEVLQNEKKKRKEKEEKKIKLVEVLLILTGFIFAGFLNLDLESTNTILNLFFGSTILIFIISAISIFSDYILDEKEEDKIETYMNTSISFPFMLIIFFVHSKVLITSSLMGAKLALIPILASTVLYYLLAATLFKSFTGDVHDNNTYYKENKWKIILWSIVMFLFLLLIVYVIPTNIGDSSDTTLEPNLVIPNSTVLVNNNTLILDNTTQPLQNISENTSSDIVMIRSELINESQYQNMMF